MEYVNVEMCGDGQSSQMASKTFTKSSGNDDDDLIQN